MSKIELKVPHSTAHVVILRERQVDDGRILCEDVHVFFGNGEPCISVDREFEGSSEGRIEGVVE